MITTTETNNSEHLIYQSDLQVKTHLSEVSIALSWFEQFHRPPLTPQLWQQAKIALMEGLTNAIRHAHQDLSPMTPIDLQVKLSSHRLQILIWDSGAAFDLEKLFDSLHLPFADPLEREEQWGAVLLRKLRDKHNWSICYICPDNKGDKRNCMVISHTMLADR
jgi:serine/threonine-protein kinase RsbW